MPAYNWLRKFPRLEALTSTVIVLVNGAWFFPSARSVSDSLFLEGMAVAVVGGIALMAGRQISRHSRRFYIGARILLFGLLLLASGIAIGVVWAG